MLDLEVVDLLGLARTIIKIGVGRAPKLLP